MHSHVTILYCATLIWNLLYVQCTYHYVTNSITLMSCTWSLLCCIHLPGLCCYVQYMYTHVLFSHTFDIQCINFHVLTFIWNCDTWRKLGDLMYETPAQLQEGPKVMRHYGATLIWIVYVPIVISLIYVPVCIMYSH